AEHTRNRGTRSGARAGGQPRDGLVRVSPADPQGREVSELHARSRRQLAVAPDGGEARRQGLRELPRLPPQFSRLTTRRLPVKSRERANRGPRQARPTI